MTDRLRSLYTCKHYALCVPVNGLVLLIETLLFMCIFSQFCICSPKYIYIALLSIVETGPDSSFDRASAPEAGISRVNAWSGQTLEFIKEENRSRVGQLQYNGSGGTTYSSLVIRFKDAALDKREVGIRLATRGNGTYSLQPR